MALGLEPLGFVLFWVSGLCGDDFGTEDILNVAKRGDGSAEPTADAVVELVDSGDEDLLDVEPLSALLSSSLKKLTVERLKRCFSVLMRELLEVSLILRIANRVFINSSAEDRGRPS
jgi:hypothetical protein